MLVIVRQTPVDEPQPLLLVADDDVQRLDISMHNTVRMTVLQSLEELVEVKSEVLIRQSSQQLLGFDARHVLEDKTRRFALLLA